MRTSTEFVRASGRLTVVLALLITTTSIATAGTWLAVSSDGLLGAREVPAAADPRVTVGGYDDTGLEVTFDLPGLEINHEHTKAGAFVSVGCPAGKPVFSLAGEIGTPALPVVRRLFVAPPEATVELSFASGPVAMVDLSAIGFGDPVVPIQAPAPMLPGAHEQAPFNLDEAAYTLDSLLPDQRVAITRLGIIRGQQLHLLEIRPVAYNPVRGTLAVWSHFDVVVRFEGGQRSVDGRAPLPPLKDVLLNPPPPPPFPGRGLGNYLIVAASDFVGSAPLNQFANAKTAQGFDVTTHSVAPGTNRTAIKDYILGLWGTADAPDYILLVGDADPAAATSSAVTIPCWIGLGYNEANTDLPYACMDAGDDWYPDCRIGRFPVRTVAQLRTVVDKTLHVAAGVFSDPDYTRRATFLAGSDYQSGDHAAHQYVIDTYMTPQGITPVRVYVRESCGTPDVTNAFNNGCVYGVYYGHSWSDQWMDGPQFNDYRVQNLANEGEYPFLINFTCEIGNFASPYYEPCYAEEWMRVDDAGAAVVIGSSSFIYYADNPGWPETANTEKFLFDSIYLDGIREIGGAWHAAMVRLVAMYGPTNPVSRDYSEMLNVIGDPSLRIPETPGFTLGADPVSQDVCSPPTDAVFYTVDVASDGGFSAPVILTASGHPAGSSVSFTVNPVTPPGTTVLIVSDLTAASPGDYDIEISGFATAAEDSTVVELGIAPGPPDPVTLLAPSDGATDVEMTPTLSWTSAPRALDYDLEIATDAAFSNVVYSATVPETVHILTSDLDSFQQYYWHVQAVNGCGGSGFTAPFTFTTVEQARYFTEHFTGDLPGPDTFDLDNFMVMFTPNGSADHYDMCGGPITALPTDPTGGTPIEVGDDRYEAIGLLYSRTVELYGLGYTTFYVGGNGYITFVSGDTDFDESLQDHFSKRRISALYHDLNPDPDAGGGGSVSWLQLDDRAVVTFENVPERSTTNSNTFQVEMFFTGEIVISWLQVDVERAIVGLSEGLGVPPDFIESDLSAADSCEPDCPGDLDYDGVVGLSDLAQLLAHYLHSGGLTYEDGDIDGDDDVDLSDLAALLGNYGPCE